MSFPVKGLSLKNISVVIDSFHLSVPDLSIPRGEVLSLMGKSGSGKSTLLSTLLGFLPLQSGSVNLDETLLSGLPPEKRHMAIVFQSGALFPQLTVEENVAFGLRVQGIAASERKKRAADWLVKLEIADLASRHPNEISGGQAQRVALARAFAVGFPILLLDEPFSAVESSLRVRLRDLTKKLVKETGVSALLVTHDVEDARALGGKVAVIDDGKLIQVGELEELRKNPVAPVVSELVSS